MVHPCIRCFFGPASIPHCCVTWPAWKSSTSTRLMYIFLLSAVTFICCILLSNNASKWADLKFELCHPILCGADAGYLLIYRTLLCVAFFHLVMAVLTIGVQSSRDIVSGVQQGFWALKILILFGMVMLSVKVRLPPAFFIGITKYAGLWGGFGFLLFAYLVMLENAYRYEDCLARNGRLMKCVTLGIIAIITSALIMITRFEKEDKCVPRYSMLRLNTVLYFIVLIMTLISGFPDRKVRPCRNLLPGAITLNYLSFLSHLISTTNICPELTKGTEKLSTERLTPPPQSQYDSMRLVLGLYLCFSTLLYLLVRRNDNHSPCSKSAGVLGRFYRRIYLRGYTATNEIDMIKYRNEHDIYDELEQVQYSWCIFHMVLCGAALFIMLMLTNLYYPKRSAKASLYGPLAIPEHFRDLRDTGVAEALTPPPSDPNAPSLLWMQVTASWACAMLYLWSLVETTVRQNTIEQYADDYAI